MNKYAAFDKDSNFVGMHVDMDMIPVMTGDIACYVNCDTFDEDVDYLTNMLTLQRLFQLRLGSTFDTQFIMNHTLYAEAELHEMLRELEGFKSWKIYNWTDEEKAEHLANAKEELIDVLHFIFNIAIALGMTAEEIFEIYVRKNLKNHERQDNGY